MRVVSTLSSEIPLLTTWRSSSLYGPPLQPARHLPMALWGPQKTAKGGVRKKSWPWHSLPRASAECTLPTQPLQQLPPPRSHPSAALLPLSGATCGRRRQDSTERKAAARRERCWWPPRSSIRGKAARGAKKVGKISSFQFDLLMAPKSSSSESREAILNTTVAYSSELLRVYTGLSPRASL